MALFNDSLDDAFFETFGAKQDGDAEAGVDDVATNSSDANASFDVASYLREHLGHRHRSFVESIVLTIVYCVILLTGVTGNVSTCIVIIKNNYLHTATNFYLFSLAISDVLTLILGLPPELYTIWEAYPWRFGESYCLFKTFLTEMTSSASILTITAFTVERFVAICYPLKAQAISSLPRALKTIVLIWLAACLTALPYPAHTRTFYYLTEPKTQVPIPDSLICNIPLVWHPQMRYVFQSSTFVLFILPIILITVLYVLIGITLRKSGITRDSMRVSSGSPNQAQSRKSVLKMLVAVVVAFFICWAPFHGQRLMTTYVRDDQWTPALLETQSQLFYVSGILYYVSSTVNPILYNLMSVRYRKAFRQTLVSCRTSELKGRRRMQTTITEDHRVLSTRSSNISSVRGGRGQRDPPPAAERHPTWPITNSRPKPPCRDTTVCLAAAQVEERYRMLRGQARQASLLLRRSPPPTYRQLYYVDRRQHEPTEDEARAEVTRSRSKVGGQPI